MCGWPELVEDFVPQMQNLPLKRCFACAGSGRELDGRYSYFIKCSVCYGVGFLFPEECFCGKQVDPMKLTKSGKRFCGSEHCGRQIG